MTNVIDWNAQKVVTYNGDYETFERTRLDRVANPRRASEENERTRAHMQVCIVMPKFVIEIKIHTLEVCQNYPRLEIHTRDLYVSGIY